MPFDLLKTTEAYAAHCSPRLHAPLQECLGVAVQPGWHFPAPQHSDGGGVWKWVSRCPAPAPALTTSEGPRDAGLTSGLGFPSEDTRTQGHQDTRAWQRREDVEERIRGLSQGSWCVLSPWKLLQGVWAPLIVLGLGESAKWPGAA